MTAKKKKTETTITATKDKKKIGFKLQNNANDGQLLMKSEKKIN